MSAALRNTDAHGSVPPIYCPLKRNGCRGVAFLQHIVTHVVFLKKTVAFQQKASYSGAHPHVD
jgi:hypothetical protein